MHTQPLIILLMCQYHNILNKYILNLSQALITEKKAKFLHKVHIIKTLSEASTLN